MTDMIKLPTGIHGFDVLSGGGLPAQRMSLIVGGAGAGKTIFALQSAVVGAKADEKTVYVCFEEDRENLVNNSAGFDWDIKSALDSKLHIIEAHMSADFSHSGMFDIEGLLAIVDAKVQETGASRVVFDAVDVLISLLDDRAAERREFFRLYDWFRKRKLTGLLTVKAPSSTSPELQEEYNFLQFMADCVVILHHRFIERTSMRTLRILKYRGSSHVADEFPMVITSQGIAVSDVTSQYLEHKAFTERVSSGIERLDTMLGGGYYRGSSILVSGAPGTAKTTLAGGFVAAACERGEKALFISFDESSDQIIRNLRSVGLDLAPHVKNKTLQMASFRTGSVSAEEHYLAMCSLLDKGKPKSLVVDPISALNRAGGQLRAVSVVLRFLDYAKSKNITTLMTSLLEHNMPYTEETRADVSTMADTWMQLSFAVQGGERNRALTIIKSRGMHHSNQVRELQLSSEGPTLKDVYTAGGEVLMGAARLEKEREVQHQEYKHQQKLKQQKLQLEEEEVRLQLQMKELEARLKAKRSELQELEADERERAERAAREHEEMLKQRHSDQKAKAAKSAQKQGKKKRGN